MDDYYNYRFSGIGRLYGEKAQQKIKGSHILVVGLGGVGSWVVEALARTGVGQLTLVDFDDICVSNFNRQIHALDSSVGQLKSHVLGERIQQINKECEVHIIGDPYNRENEAKVFCRDYDYAIDAIDISLLKEHFILACRERKIPMTVVGSTGGRKDPSKIRVDDLARTKEDTMLHIIRKNLRQQHSFPRGKDKFKIPTVYSIEKPLYPTSNGGTSLEKPEDFLKPLDCQTGMGAATFLTGAVAFYAASTAIESITSDL